MGFAESDPNSSTELTTGSQPNRTLAAETAPWRTPMLDRKGPKYSVTGLGSKTVAGPGWAVAEDFQSSVAASVLFCLLYHQLEK